MANIDYSKCQDTTYGQLAGGGNGGGMVGGGAQNAWGECLRCGKYHLVGQCEIGDKVVPVYHGGNLSVVEAPLTDSDLARWEAQITRKGSAAALARTKADDPTHTSCMHDPAGQLQTCPQCTVATAKTDIYAKYESQIRDHLAEPKTAYEGGASRTTKTERYDLVPPEAIDAIARRMGLGVPKHGENNWRGGGVEFIKATINHLYAHLSALLRGDETDSHLDAVTCNAAFLCWFKANKPKDYVQALTSLRHPPHQRTLFQM